MLKQVRQKVLKTVEKIQSRIPFSTGILTVAATSFLFGLDKNTDSADERYLIHNLVAYMKIVLDHIPPDLSERSKFADGHTFGKTV